MASAPFAPPQSTKTSVSDPVQTLRNVPAYLRHGLPPAITGNGPLPMRVGNDLSRTEENNEDTLIGSGPKAVIAETPRALAAIVDVLLGPLVRRTIQEARLAWALWRVKDCPGGGQRLLERTSGVRKATAAEILPFPYEVSETGLIYGVERGTSDGREVGVYILNKHLQPSMQAWLIADDLWRDQRLLTELDPAMDRWAPVRKDHPERVGDYAWALAVSTGVRDVEMPIKEFRARLGLSANKTTDVAKRLERALLASVQGSTSARTITLTFELALREGLAGTTGFQRSNRKLAQHTTERTARTAWLRAPSVRQAASIVADRDAYVAELIERGAGYGAVEFYRNASEQQIVEFLTGGEIDDQSRAWLLAERSDSEPEDTPEIIPVASPESKIAMLYTRLASVREPAGQKPSVISSGLVHSYQQIL